MSAPLMTKWDFGKMVGGLLLVACAGTDAEFDENRQKWRSERPEEYVIVACGTGFDGGCSLFAVSGENIVASAHSTNRSPSGDDWTFAEDLPKPGDPVEDLFDVAQNLGGDCSFRTLSFDDDFGYVDD